MIDVKKLESTIINIGLKSIEQSGDKTEIKFTLGNDRTVTIYSKEIEIDYVDSNMDVDGTVFVQSELRLMEDDLA